MSVSEKVFRRQTVSYPLSSSSVGCPKQTIFLKRSLGHSMTVLNELSFDFDRQGRRKHPQRTSSYRLENASFVYFVHQTGQHQRCYFKLLKLEHWIIHRKELLDPWEVRCFENFLENQLCHTHDKICDVLKRCDAENTSGTSFEMHVCVHE